MQGRTVNGLADMLGRYTLTAYCENFRCERIGTGVPLDIAALIAAGYKGAIGRTVYRCSQCGEVGRCHQAPIWTGPADLNQK